jgi:hypothetical protein
MNDQLRFLFPDLFETYTNLVNAKLGNQEIELLKVATLIEIASRLGFLAELQNLSDISQEKLP